MPASPETCSTLLVRLRDPADQQAWREFVDLYRPVVYRVARRRGLQPADADDLTQQVMLAVAKSIESWTPDPERGRFRTWLHRVANNLTINALTRRGIAQAVGGSGALRQMNGAVDPREADSQWLDIEHRRELFRRAADAIRPEFGSEVWQAFTLTMIDGLTVDQAAARLGKKPGAIYAGRSRVMRRLREEVEMKNEI